MKDANILRVVEKIRTTVCKYYDTIRDHRRPKCPLLSTTVPRGDIAMDATNLTQFETIMTDYSAPPSAADTAMTVDAFVRPAVRTFQDAVGAVERSLDCSIPARRVMKTALRQIAWAVAIINARNSGQYLDPDRKALDLACVLFDLPVINRALAGVRYRMAGFSSDKSFRNAKSAQRRIGRELGMVAPHRAPELPPESPCAPLLAAADEFQLASARRFAARMMQKGRLPCDVTGDDLRQYGTYLASQLVGVKIEPMLRRIVQLWRRTASGNPNWPQTPLTLGGQPKPFSAPFAAYSVALQEEIAAVRRWMEGSDRRGPFSLQRDRKPLRPKTIKLRLACIRLLLAEHVAQGNDPAAVTSLTDLLFSPAAIEAILQAIWERGQIRHQARVEAEPGWNGNTGQLDAVAVTLLMLASYFPPPPDVLKKLQGLAKAVRKSPMSGMSRKNQQRLEQFRDPVKLGLLLNLARTLMAEALELRTQQPAEAARLARTAIFFAIELRIPLRMQNLHTCRLGHNLRFAGPGSPLAILSFQIPEMKTKRDTEYSVSERLCQFLHVYIERNSQVPPLDRYAESKSMSSPVGMVSARRMLIPCFRVVEMTERMEAKISAPPKVRKPPEIFILTFIMRMSCSAWLLVNGTAKSSVKRSTSALQWRKRSSRLCPVRRGGLPRAPGERTSGAWPSCKANPVARAAS
jgi:hypothetical protein